MVVTDLEDLAVAEQTDTDRILSAIDASHQALDKKVTKKFEHLDAQMADLARRLTFVEAEHHARSDTALGLEKRLVQERHDGRAELNAGLLRLQADLDAVEQRHDRLVTRAWGLLVGVIIATFAAILAWLKK